MGKVSPEARERYLEKVNQFGKHIEDISKREEMILQTINQESVGSEFKKIRLADENLNLASYYILMNNLSLSLLGVKNEAFLNNARKLIYKVLIYLEQVVTDSIDYSFSEYGDKVLAIDAYDPLSRLTLCNKIGLTIQRVSDGFGDNSKWKWSFVELEGRLAVVCKNFLNQKTLFGDLDPDKEFYEIKFNHLNLAKKLLDQAASRYREKYELSSFQIEDFKVAIKLLEGLRKLFIAINRHNDADNLKRKIDTWQQKLDYDLKKKDLEKKGRG
ncbi:MAG: hypothetical protein A2Z96_06115 [Spirochaetes bacterium GWB1_48_6]|nr:MAG: hypothetical protein A2Z96_06115 [Spirochaetes bacterium GWB1_48_6]